MATHGRTGEALEAHRRRKRKSHIVSGLYVADGSTKPIRMSSNAFHAKLRVRGGGKGKTTVVHYKRYRSAGRGRKS